MIRRKVDLGTAEIRSDPERPGAYMLHIDGVAQSYVDLADPTHLEFEYMRRLSWLIDTIAPAGKPLDVLHLGGGALTMARYVAATRPGSAQEVVERDAALIDLVESELPLPVDAGVTITLDDARAALEAAPAGRFDLVIVDVYRAARMPRSVTSVEFVRAAARVLTHTGRYAANVVDVPPLAFSRVQAATVREVFADACVLSEAGLLRGRRYGNVVIAGARRRGGLPVERMTRTAQRDPLNSVFGNRVVHGPDLDRWIGAAVPAQDDDAEDGPVPPPPLLG
ncbi:hypothetical protein Val02_53370 [Virgisporangium aliadipatigenens]|uniref:Spermidine synthase n=1 Tax=Virgisporangium aliadipatigenens TaxID=741659 RepID=A0A8J3YNF9_9ACTN|nr:fused MFS/spermidine synthase [Virgisporangium aliadipatigenens]GIJ48451.1 hypothetical protein Val02_53370 [Virgisporangium aliadipatigenens]